MENGSRRQVTIAGDWGTGPGFTIAGWLAAGLMSRSDGIDWPLVRTFPGAMDCLRAVATGACDVSMTLPECNIEMARRGVGPFATAYPELRVIGRLPHDTFLTFIAGPDLAGMTIGEVLSSPDRTVRLATRAGSFGSMGAVVHRILDHYRDAVNLEIVETPPAYGSSRALLEGRADAILHQASLEIWRELSDAADVRFISLDVVLVDELERELGCARRIASRDDLPVPDDVLGIDWSDFFIVCRSSLEDDIAYAVAETVVDDAAVLEDLMFREDAYSHLTSRIHPEAVPSHGLVPTHEAAAAFFADRGLR